MSIQLLRKQAILLLKKKGERKKSTNLFFFFLQKEIKDGKKIVLQELCRSSETGYHYRKYHFLVDLPNDY